ncbi:F-box and associated interaction domains-containing protein, partial [Prunus dulcis]
NRALFIFLSANPLSHGVIPHFKATFYLASMESMGLFDPIDPTVGPSLVRLGSNFLICGKKIHQAFCERAIGSTRTEMTLSSRWKILNKELAKWRNVLAKAMDNHKAEKTLAMRLCKHKCGLVLLGKGKKSFNHTHCWEVMKTCNRFQIIPTGPTVVLNETPLHETRHRIYLWIPR